jgi:quinol monooxygenase YgiN
MKIAEKKKKEKLPKYITSKALEEHLNSKEMQDLLKKLQEMEEYKEKTRNVSVGQY